MERASVGVEQAMQDEDRKRRLGILALSVAESFGKESIGSELAQSMRTLFPDVVFVRVAMRSGTGLFVTDNLLQSGFCMVNLVSLKSSMSGMCMKEGKMVQLRIPDEAVTANDPRAIRLIMATPSRVMTPAGESFRHLTVGSVIIGSHLSTASEDLRNRTEDLARALGPSLLTVGLPQVSHLSHLLQLRDQDSEFIGAEESLQDLPWDVPRPPGDYEAFRQKSNQGMEADTCKDDESGSDTGSEGEENVGNESSSVENESSLTALSSSNLNELVGTEAVEDRVQAYLADSRQASAPSVDCCSSGKEETDRMESNNEANVYCAINQNRYGDSWKRNDIKGKNQQPMVPQSLVKTCVLLTYYVVISLGFAVSHAENISFVSIMPLIPALGGLMSATAGLSGKYRTLAAMKDIFLVAFVLLNFCAALCDQASHQKWQDAKYKLARSLLLLESTLTSCGVTLRWSMLTHVAVGIAGVAYASSYNE